MLEHERLIEALSQFLKPPHLVTEEIGLGFVIGFSPYERTSENSPAGWEHRKERWEIDNFLGKYVPEKREIIIYNKSVDFVSTQMKVDKRHLEYVVRLHEWGHAAFHLAVTQEESFNLTKSSVEQDQQAIDAHLATFARAYQSVKPYVHEQLAQVLTYLMLDRLVREAKLEEAKKAGKSLQELFHALMRRQPRRYQLKKSLLDLKPEVLARRVAMIIPLLRARKIRGDSETWDKILSW